MDATLWTTHQRPPPCQSCNEQIVLDQPLNPSLSPLGEPVQKLDVQWYPTWNIGQKYSTTWKINLKKEGGCGIIMGRHALFPIKRILFRRNVGVAPQTCHALVLQITSNNILLGLSNELLIFFATQPGWTQPVQKLFEVNVEKSKIFFF